jgi:hypothetical protein
MSGASSPDSPEGRGALPSAAPQAAAPSADARLAWMAAAAGLAGLWAYRLLVAEPAARWVIVAVDVVAIGLGVWLLARRRRYRGGADLAVAAILMAGFSLYLFMARVTGALPVPGGT